MGCRIGEEGYDSGPERNGPRRGKAKPVYRGHPPSAQDNRLAPYRLAAATGFRGRGHEVRILHGGRRPPGPDHLERWEVEDDIWRGQKEGSVAAYRSQKITIW